MNLEELFLNAVKKLQNSGKPYAVAGGFAASLYREQARLTADVDFIIMLKPSDITQGSDILQGLGLGTRVVRLADLKGGPQFAKRAESTPECVLVGRFPDDKSGAGVDLIMPSLPWVEAALERAQSNLVDFGFGKLPVLTIEDVVLSKLFALQSSPTRMKDLDDLQSIQEAGHATDKAYLKGRIIELEIGISKNVRSLMPKEFISLLKW